MKVNKTTRVTIDTDDGRQIVAIVPQGDCYSVKMREYPPMLLTMEEMDALNEALHEVVSDF